MALMSVNYRVCLVMLFDVMFGREKIFLNCEANISSHHIGVKTVTSIMFVVITQATNCKFTKTFKGII